MNHPFGMQVTEEEKQRVLIEGMELAPQVEKALMALTGNPRIAMMACWAVSIHQSMAAGVSRATFIENLVRWHEIMWDLMSEEN